MFVGFDSQNTFYSFPPIPIGGGKPNLAIRNQTNSSRPTRQSAIQRLRPDDLHGRYRYGHATLQWRAAFTLDLVDVGLSSDPT